LVEGHPQGDGRHGQQELDHALYDRVRDPGIVPADAAQDHAEDKAQDDAHQTNREGNRAAVEDPREHIPAQFIGAEEENRAALGHAKEVDSALDQAEELVIRSGHKESNRVAHLDVLNIGARKLFPVHLARYPVHKGPHPLAVVGEMELLRFEVDILGALDRVVGRQEAVKDGDQVEDAHDHATGDGQLVLGELEPHQLPLGVAVDLVLFPGCLSASSSER
jgi:hypothetical protein